ncbi:putative DNA-binding transcriptional regulator AlpA [Ancylobacter sp. 3268]|uniref:helix-turn-helix transcriptional regulator n=1 Tax=Ancylobacter sp. 3268 TaxID=2817752 RepID=UPI00285B0300|nr:hypothetical protein [Ancylobacter sp. 3268]MDR6952335.1 putative DNA-binding transcriptional regulator AlpA [Ancylobacter sp. 3268]
MQREPRYNPLPDSLPPRGVHREAAAAYIGVSPRKFDELVADGRMPPPKRIDARNVWDRRRLDEFFDKLPDLSAGKTSADADDEWNFRA